MRLLLVCVVMSAALCSVGSGTELISSEDVVVVTSDGPIVGTRQNGVSAFLGVPYAAPPVKALRLRPPQTLVPWSVPRPAHDFGPPCPQTAELGTPSAVEDCLTLNVYEQSSTPGRPVVVFLYGGSFKYGSAGVAPGGNGPNYSGVEIARRTDTIVIAVNYRLGALGFLAAPALDAENAQHVSGNYGLLDQQAALRWIKSNARAFGGDPDDITIFGQSAGAASIVDQMISPTAAGLFSHAALESVGSMAVAPLAEVENADRAIIAQVGCGHALDVAACLREAPVAAFVGSDRGIIGPVVDGFVLPMQPMVAFASGAFAHVPVIEGSNRDEGTFFIAAAAEAQGHAFTLDGANAILGHAFADQAPAIAEHYGLAGASSPGEVLASILTDEFFSCPAYAIRALLETQIPVIEYEFSQPHPAHNYPIARVPSIIDGDAHTTELAYVFGHDGAGQPLSGDNARLSDIMIDALGLFAWYGQGAMPFASVPLVTTNGVVVELATPIHTTDKFEGRHQCSFWASLGNPTVLFQ